MSTVYDGHLIAQMPRGELRTFDDNETVHRSLMQDPSKGRFSVKQDLVESNLGSNSYNIERPSGELDEMVLTGARLLPDGSGCFFVAIADKQGDSVREILVASRHGLSGPAAPAQAKVTRFYTDGGKFCFNFQDDGSVPSGVVYDTKSSTDESTWVAIGRLRIDPL